MPSININPITIKKEKKMKIEAHLLKTKDDVLEFSGAFNDTQEENFVPAEFMIRGVAIAGTRLSQNGYEYTDGAFNSLVTLSEGARVFLDHPSTEQDKATGGVRPIQDFAGVFRNIHRDGDRVFGDLYTRESFYPMFKDIVRLQPEGVGMSINARVKVFKDQNGKESVVDIDKLRSVDLVTSASLCRSLWESVDESLAKQNKETEEKDLNERVVGKDNADGCVQSIINFGKAIAYHDSELNRLINKEGVISKKMKQDDVKHEIDRFIWKASDMVYDIIRDEKMSIKDKKSKIEGILDDLDSEIQTRLKKVKDDAKETGMRIIVPDEDTPPMVSVPD